MVVPSIIKIPVEKLRIEGFPEGAVVEWVAREAGEADSRAEAVPAVEPTESVSVPDVA
jgi:hypothetical protein